MFPCQGAFGALQKICEDCCDQLSSSEMSQSLTVLLPKFIQFFGHSSPTVKSHAIACVNHFVAHQPPALVSNILPFIKVTHKHTPAHGCQAVCMYVCLYGTYAGVV